MSKYLTDKTHCVLIYAILLIIFATGLRFFHLTYAGLRLDEIKTVARAEAPVDEMVDKCFRGGHFPFYFFAVKAWTQIFGNSEFALRSMSILFATLGLIWFWRLARLLLSPSAALTALLLFSLNQVNIWADKEVRMYSVIIFISTAAGYYLIKYIYKGGKTKSII